MAKITMDYDEFLEKTSIRESDTKKEIEDLEEEQKKLLEIEARINQAYSDGKILKIVESTTVGLSYMRGRPKTRITNASLSELMDREKQDAYNEIELKFSEMTISGFKKWRKNFGK